MKDLPHSVAESLLQSCPIAMLLIADNGNIQGFNRAFAALLGEAASTLEGTAQADALLAPLLGTGTLVNWITPDGAACWLAVESCAIDHAPGLTARYYRDVTETLRLKKERDDLRALLRKQAIHDEQRPSLLSRYGLQVSLEPLVSRSRRYNTPLSLVSINVETDHDRDKAIAKVSYLLKDQTRWADLVGCNANHDFILILQESTQDAALQLVDKLVSRIAQLNQTEQREIRACFGVTRCQRNDDAASMLERVESALAEARQSDSGTAIAV
jgi:GGDEF domain-containing protein